MGELADRPVDALSGGQRQRAWISMALAQGADLLLLDEPTTYLDLAARYAQRLVAMRDGVLVASGRPAEVLTEALLAEVLLAEVLLAEVLDLEARILTDPSPELPWSCPVRRLR